MRTQTDRDDARQAPAGIPARFYRGLGLRAQGDIAGMTVYRTRRGKLVLFPKTAPKTPAGPLALRNQNRFRLAAAAWRQLPTVVRQAWTKAAHIASLGCTGYNLFIAWQMKGDRAMVATVERATGLILVYEGG